MEGASSIGPGKVRFAAWRSCFCLTPESNDFSREEYVNVKLCS